MDRYAYGGFPIFIADRGFSSYNVFAHAIENNVDFMIRAKDLNVQHFLGLDSIPDKLDTTVELILTRIQSKKKHKYSEKESQYCYICKNIAFDYLDPEDISDEYPTKLLIVRFEVANGIFENIITTPSPSTLPQRSDLKPKKKDTNVSKFSIHAPAKERLSAARAKGLYPIFQSTLPRRSDPA